METEALKPWRTEAYFKYVGVRQGATPTDVGTRKVYA